MSKYNKCPKCGVKPFTSLVNCVSGDAACWYERICPSCHTNVMANTMLGAYIKFIKMSKEETKKLEQDEDMITAKEAKAEYTKTITKKYLKKDLDKYEEDLDLMIKSAVGVGKEDAIYQTYSWMDVDIFENYLQPMLINNGFGVRELQSTGVYYGAPLRPYEKAYLIAWAGAFAQKKT